MVPACTVQVKVSVIVTDFKYNTSVSPVFLQAVRIDYLQGNEGSAVIVQNSGNPGYQTGYPLLVSGFEWFHSKPWGTCIAPV